MIRYGVFILFIVAASLIGNRGVVPVESILNNSSAANSFSVANSPPAASRSSVVSNDPAANHVSPPIRSQDSRTAQVSRAESLRRGGEFAESRRIAREIIAAYGRGSAGWSAADHVAAGRAYLLVADSDVNAVRSALGAFDAATARDPSSVEGEIRASDLFLEKYNAPDAKSGYNDVLRKSPGNARALLGLARVAAFDGEGDALTLVQRAIATDSRLGDAHRFAARLYLESEDLDSAQVSANRALAVDSSAVDAWGMLGAVAWLSGDSAALRRARSAAERINPRPAEFYVVLADAASRNRRYSDAQRFSAQALALDSTSLSALGSLGTNLLRGGDIAGGRALIERAFALDPFNLWHKNTLDLLDELATFRVERMGRFEFVAPQREAEVLLPYLSPLLEEAYDKLAAKYGYRPTTPVRLEIFPRHADFSVRTVGLTGLGALGVSFGRVLAMDAPSARDPGTFNWGSTAWHELAHTFTLGLSGHRVPRWFTEGVSVLEERRARAGWGAEVTPVFLELMRDGKLRPVSTLNDGFVRPRNPAEVGLSYYQASLVCEMIEEEFGAKALGDMLRAWGDGLTTAEVFQRVLRVDEAAMDSRFNAWLRRKFSGQAGTVALRNDADIDWHLRRADELEKGGDTAGMVRELESSVWIWPYDERVHVRLAEGYTQLGAHGKSVRARRTVVALGPTDILEARYQLARSLLAAGDRAAARREILSVLERAPTFDKALALLLELQQSQDNGGEA